MVYHWTYIGHTLYVMRPNFRVWQLTMVYYGQEGEVETPAGHWKPALSCGFDLKALKHWRLNFVFTRAAMIFGRNLYLVQKALQSIDPIVDHKIRTCPNPEKPNWTTKFPLKQTVCFFPPPKKKQTAHAFRFSFCTSVPPKRPKVSASSISQVRVKCLDQLHAQTFEAPIGLSPFLGASFSGMERGRFELGKVGKGIILVVSVLFSWLCFLGDFY